MGVSVIRVSSARQQYFGAECELLASDLLVTRSRYLQSQCSSAASASAADRWLCCSARFSSCWRSRAPLPVRRPARCRLPLPFVEWLTHSHTHTSHFIVRIESASVCGVRTDESPTSTVSSTVASTTAPVYVLDTASLGVPALAFSSATYDASVSIDTLDASATADQPVGSVSVRHSHSLTPLFHSHRFWSPPPRAGAERAHWPQPEDRRVHTVRDDVAVWLHCTVLYSRITALC